MGTRIAEILKEVAEDFNEGWISKERAKDTYGVIIDSNGIVNKEMTLALRGYTAKI